MASLKNEEAKLWNHIDDGIIKKLTDDMYKALCQPITFNAPELKISYDATGEEETPKLQDKWIWVEGYKGTNKDMQGHGNYQFEVGKRYDMPTDVEIKECHAGFHLSLNMKDVFNHYGIHSGNRFFKVRALVRERDLNNYGKDNSNTWFRSHHDKLVSQSIEFIRELTVEEVFQDTEYSHWSEEYKKEAMEAGIGKVKSRAQAAELAELGYSEAFAAYVVKKNRYDTAKAVASQPGLSMDMKALMIMEW